MSSLSSEEGDVTQGPRLHLDLICIFPIQEIIWYDFKSCTKGVEEKEEEQARELIASRETEFGQSLNDQRSPIGG